MRDDSIFILSYRKLVAARKRTKYSKIEIHLNNNKGRRFGMIPPNILIKLLKSCPIGDGELYEHLVGDSIAKILYGIVDSAIAGQQISIGEGFCDIEFPICTEVIDKYPLWDRWCDQYNVKSILLEVKNMKKKAAYEDINQLEVYLRDGDFGKLGIIVSRSGFARSADSTIRSIAKKGILIIPISHEDLQLLLEFSMQNTLKVMTFLRRRGNLILRSK